MAKNKRKIGEGSFIYANACINAIAAVLRVAERLGMKSSDTCLLLAETQMQARGMRYRKDFAKPFCDRAVANALVGLKPLFDADLVLRVDAYLDEFAARLAEQLATSAPAQATITEQVTQQ